MMPCQLCCYPNWVEKGDATEYSELMCTNHHALRSSAAAGCCGCHLLIEGWHYAIPEESDRERVQITFNKRLLDSQCHMYLHVFPLHGDRVFDIDLFTLPNQPSFKHIRAANLIPRTTGLFDNLTRIQRWLHLCENHHQLCVSSPVEYPLRLLDVETLGPTAVRLIELSSNSKGLPLNGRFACLSHCWGQTSRTYITKQSNFKSHCESIPITTLPLTFREAITITRALSIPYIWIDSMCIIQDDAQDWKYHVGRMAKIYGSAYVTLAAGASADDNGGIFREASAKHVDTSVAKVRDEHDQEYDVFMRHCLSHPDANWPSGRRLPLMQRGWVYQERLLSRRYLCFAENEILWECKEDVACSCSASGGSDFNYRQAADEPRFPNCLATKYRFSHLAMLTKGQLERLWKETVESYSQRDLTFPDDKLPALDGIRQAFHETMTSRGLQDIYLWGMWKGFLKSQLQWQSRFQTAGDRPREAPSWSWVSATDGHIEIEDNLEHTNWTVRDTVDLELEPNESQRTAMEALLLHASLSEPLIIIPCPIDVQNTRAMEKIWPGYRLCLVYKQSSQAERYDTIIIDSKDKVVSEDIFPTLLSNANEESTPLTIDAFQDLSTNLGQWGEVWADFPFWSDETELPGIVRGVRFLEIGQERPWSRSSVKDSMSTVGGLLLRESTQKLDGKLMFERIGWLRHTTEKKEQAKRPTGIIQDILIL